MRKSYKQTHFLFKIILAVALLFIIESPGLLLAKSVTYIYDANGRLECICTEGNSYKISYDKNGNMVSKVLDINGGFERDVDGDKLPDFWETQWRNGSSTGNKAEQAPHGPSEGTSIYRLYNGTGDLNSVQYADSNSIPVQGGGMYEVRVNMRYALTTGEAQLGIIEFDGQGTQLDYTTRPYKQGNWTWVENMVSVETKPNTRWVKIRISVGGEEGAYLDLDQLSWQAVDLNGGFERDVDGDKLPDFWETQWRSGTSTGNKAEQVPYGPLEGQSVYRLTNGDGDRDSIQYADSNFIPVRGNSTYEAGVGMRYALTTGEAQLGIIEFDISGNQLNYTTNLYKQGNWTWVNKTLSIQTTPSTRYVKIRISIGGEEEAILDLDRLSWKRP